MTEANENTRHATLEELRAMKDRGEIHPPADGVPDFDVPSEFWANAVPLVEKAPKKAVSLRIDRDVFDWFKAQGEGHLTRMNAVLRSYYEAHQD